MNDAPIWPDLSHPDSLIRLASAVHRFPCPEILQAKKVVFSKSFQTAAVHGDTVSLMHKGDQTRCSLADALVSARSSSGRNNGCQEMAVLRAQEYLPTIHSILTSCKIQPEQAKLDQRLNFEWASGLEKVKLPYKNEALMYELVMTIATVGIGTAGTACDECRDGNFAKAGKLFQQSSGILQHLCEEKLPRWIARGSALESASNDFPAECNVGVCDAFCTFFLAVGQQMAVATVLIKPGVPNYSLLAKLCLGIADQMDDFVSTLRSKASSMMSKIDAHFFALVTFQTTLHRALSLYFLSRATWDKQQDYGIAIAMLHGAMQKLKTRDSIVSEGMPEIVKGSPLKPLEKDLFDFRAHMKTLLSSWESDNSKVYFVRVPTTLPQDRLIPKGLRMTKPLDFVLDNNVEPVHLGPLHDAAAAAANEVTLPPPYTATAISSDNHTADDEALAREMQAKLNRGEWD